MEGTSQKRIDLFEKLRHSGIVLQGHVITAGEGDIFCSRDAVRKLSPGCRRHHHIITEVHDESRNLHFR